MNAVGVERRASSITVVSGLSTLLRLAFQLISVPICLKYWGKGTYGGWLTIYSAFTLIRSVDAGYVTYVGNELNCLYHADPASLRLHLASSLPMISLIGLLQLGVGVAAILFGFKSGVASELAHYAGPHGIGWALFVLIATWALSGSYLGIIHRLMIPTGLMYQSVWWAMGYQTCQFVGIVLAAVLRMNLFQASLIFAAIQFSIYASSAVYVRYKIPDYYPWWRGGDLRTGLRDLARSSLLTISGVVDQGAASGVVMLLSALAGPAAVPVFTTIRTMSNLWTNATNVTAAPLLPEVVRYRAKKEGSKLAATVCAYWVFVGTAVNLGVLFSYPLILPLYLRWTMHALTLDRSLLCLLLGSVVVANAGGAISLYFNGINSLGLVLSASLIRAGAVLLGGGLLYKFVGLAGFGIAILAGELAVLGLLGRQFLGSELGGLSASIRAQSVSAAMLSTLSALTFLIAEACGFRFVAEIYWLAVMGIFVAAAMGWKNLDTEVQARFTGLIRSRLIGLSAA